jgi:DNA polymerase III delta prime subunit
VQDDTQKARDNDRKRILEQELAGEQRSLEQAKKELAEQEAVRLGDERNYQKMLDRLQPYKDRVGQHERNIQAIQKELGALR